jgi:hypothetical protein
MPDFGTLIYDLAEQLGGVYKGTLTAGTTALLTDVSADGIQSTRWSSDRFVDWYVVITSGSASGEIRVVKTYDPANGTLTPDDAFANTPGTASYEIIAFDRPDSLGVGKFINMALKNLKYPTEWMVNEVTNGDFEASTATTNWNATNSSIAEVTTAANVLRGAKSMSVTATSALGRAQSDSIAVIPGQVVYCEATVKCTPGDSFRLVLYNVTGSSAIRTWDDYAGAGWGTVGASWETVPAGCLQVALQLIAVANTDVIYVDNATMNTQNRRFYTLPSTFDMMQPVYVEKLGGTGSILDALNRTRDAVGAWDVFPNATAANPYTLELKSSDGRSGGPLSVRYKRRFSALSARTDSTPMHQEFVLAAARVEAFKSRANDSIGDEHTHWNNEALLAAVELQQLSMMYSPDVPNKEQVPS